MKKIVSIVSIAALSSSVLAFGAAAGENTDMLYGTMDIPFAQFYEAEGVGYEVDAVSSATSNKWKNQDMFPGAVSVAHTDDDGGDIVGITYPVAISAEALAELGEDNYNFTALDKAQAAYKLVEVVDGNARFSAVQGETVSVENELQLSTDTAWGDYQLELITEAGETSLSDTYTILGAMLKMSDGSVYALRTLENTWMGKYSWSVGFKTEEPHGNKLSYENFADTMGKTLSELVLITETGYVTVDCDLYIPIKFVGSVSVEDAAIDAGNTAFELVDLPEDYEASFFVDGLAAEVSANCISYTDALPGQYTLTVSDAAGKYANMSASFILSTDELPLVYDEENGQIVAAEGADEALAQAFIANLSTVKVNEESYNASGRGAVAIVEADGTVDPEAAQIMGRGADATENPIFAENGDYQIEVSSVGFSQTLTFTFTK